MTHLDQTFAALSDTTRRAILARLASGDVSLSDLAVPFDMSQTAVSKHVRVLSDAGLVSVRKRGRTRYCTLHTGPMQEAVSWLEKYQSFWTGQFDALSKHMEGKTQ
ncbi:MAG: metalloregulator ArsR/SmtB family transcription factor [Pseudomonadota bacterium]